MRRALRAQERECDDAAQEFANAQILYTCVVYSVAVIRKHHDELGSFKRQKMFLDDQLTIMTTGWGYSDLAHSSTGTTLTLAVCVTAGSRTAGSTYWSTY